MNKQAPLLALEVEDVIKSFAETMVLRSINFSLQPGEVAVLLGANGAGKSTLMSVLYGFRFTEKILLKMDLRPVH